MNKFRFSALLDTAIGDYTADYSTACVNHSANNN